MLKNPSRVITMIVTVLLAGCGARHYYEPTEGTIGSMTPVEARETVVALSKGRSSGHKGDRPPYIDATEVKWHGIEIRYRDAARVTCRYDQMTKIESGSFWDIADYFYVGLPACKNPHDNFFLVAYFPDANTADRFANAVYVLRQRYLMNRAPETPQQQAAFDAIARQFHAGQYPPALPEGAQRYKAQAEFAVQQKRFDDAVDLYGKALEVAPWWPAGYFNRGQLLGGLEAYAEAVRDLQKYLKLVPEAPNAQAVQTLIYQWESLTPGNR